MRHALIGVLVAAAIATGALGQGSAKPFGTPIATEGGIEVYAKADFEDAQPLLPSGAAKLTVDTETAIGGRSLHVTRTGPEGGFGVNLPLQIAGSKGLKIAFCIRAKGMERISVNLRDTVKDDNTTPRTPALLGGVQDEWATVVLHVEDFRYNGGDSTAIDADTKFTRLHFHGKESTPGSGEYWLDNLIVYRGADLAAPKPPTKLKITPGEGGKVLLAWEQPADNAFPAIYSIHRRIRGRWTKVAETRETKFTDTIDTPGLQNWRVTAADYEDNVSTGAIPKPVSVKSAAEKTKPADGPCVKDRRIYSGNVQRIHAAGSRRSRRGAMLIFGGTLSTTWLYQRSLVGTLRRGMPIDRAAQGEGTEYAKKKVRGILTKDKPQYAIIMFGSADEKRDAASIAKAVANVSAVVDACQRNGTIPIVATIPPRANVGDQAEQENYNKALMAMARKKRVPVSYCHEALTAGDQVTTIDSQEGVQAASRALLKTFRQIGWAIRDSSLRLR